MTLRPWFGVVVVATASALIAASGGCTIVTSDTPLDGGSFDGNTSSNTDSGTTPATGCNECLFQQCAASWSVCQNQTECLAIYTCATKPGCDQQCVTACFHAHPCGQKAYAALSNCDSFYSCSTCNAQCKPAANACPATTVSAQDTCTVPADAGATDATPPEDSAVPPTDGGSVSDCTSCTSSKCGAEKSACGPSSECESYTLCLAACQDSACFDKCATDHPTGKTASQALETCTTSNCQEACGL